MDSTSSPSSSSATGRGAGTPAHSAGATTPAQTGATTPAQPAGGDVPVQLNKVKPVPKPATWVSAVIALVLLAMLVHALLTNPNFEWPLVQKYLFSPLILKGVGWTLILTVAAMAIGIVLAVAAAVMRRSSNPVLRWVSWAYIFVFRGTPIYTQLIFWGLLPVLYQRLSVGVPFGPEFFAFQTRDVINGAVAAIIGLGLNEGAYLSEIVRAGLNSVGDGQEEAARALGMKRSQIMRRIILPQAMRTIVPPTGNETISMLKTTSLVTAVPFTLELTFVTSTIGSRSFHPVPLLIVAALWYLVITSILMVGQHYLEAYYGRGFTESSSRRGKKKPSKQEAINAAGTTHAAPFIDVTP